MTRNQSAATPRVATPDATALAAYVDAAARALALPLADEHRPGVLRYFALAAALAAELESIALAPEDESASVFVPVSPLQDGD